VSLDDFSSAGNSGPASLAPRSLSSPVDGVSLWFVALTVSDDEFARIADWLSPAEHSRAARFGREYLRRRYVIGRASLRWALGRALSLPAGAVPIVRGERGRPRLDGIDGIDFNISHTGDAALIGIAHGGSRIGVDIERADRGVNADGLARKFLTPVERATLASLSANERRARFVRYWTCKEALSKATGDGLSAPFREMEITLGENIALTHGPEPYDPSRWRLHGADVPGGYVATLALSRGSGLP
jgi:4'-phosphopantetheinyl transferase